MYSFTLERLLLLLGPVYMEWGTPVQWGKFLLFCVPQSVKTKETYPTRPGSPTPCKQGLKEELLYRKCQGDVTRAIRKDDF